MKYSLLSLIVILAIGGCASQTAYQPASGNGYGYQESQLADNRYRIAFKMRGDQRIKAMDYALLRAAELTLMAGHDWFVVNDRQILANTERESAAIHTGVSNDRVVTQDCGLLGCSTRSYPTTRYSAGVSNGTSSREQTEALLEIRMGKGVRPAEGDSYDALEIRDNLRKHYDR